LGQHVSIVVVFVFVDFVVTAEKLVVAASDSVLQVILMRRGQQKGLEIRAWRRWGNLLLDRSTGHHRR
jgi:hypothetical protein